MAAATGTVRAEDRPEIIKPWIAPEGTRARVLRGLEDRPAPRQFEDRSSLRQAPFVARPYQDRSAGLGRRQLRQGHRATQYRSDLKAARGRLEQEQRSDRRGFDRLQRLRREESRLRR